MTLWKDWLHRRRVCGARSRADRTARPRRRLHEALERRDLLAGDLRIVEFNYHPHEAMVQFGERDQEADDFEFVEVSNVGDSLISLSGYRISDAVRFVFGQQFLAPGERLVVTKDLRDFRSRYGIGVPVAIGSDGQGGDGGEYQGSLNNNSETIQLYDPSGNLVQEITYHDSGEWGRMADGRGTSLEVVDPFADGSDPKNWKVSSEYGGSPGWAGHGYVGDVVINEILTHTDLPQIDAIELYNPSEDIVDMTDWYLTDSLADLYRFRIDSVNSSIFPNDYATFDENQLGFSFRGQEADDAFLLEMNSAGKPIRFVDYVEYSATQNGVTLGRWPDAVGDLFPMTQLTFDDNNSGPLIGSVVVSELNYHPSTDGAPGLLGEQTLEYIEISNRTGVNLDLSHWRLREAVDFTFPPGTTVPAAGSILALGFSPFANPNLTRSFLDFYGIGDNVSLFGPYSDADDPNADQLDNDGERLILERPEDPDQLGLGYVLVDRVTYDDDGAWPEAADGQGASLTRDSLEAYGDFGTSWSAQPPTPGVIGLPGDVNSNGVVDVVDIDTLCLALGLGSQNPVFDLNGNGQVTIRDFDYMIEDIFQTSFGDSNLDGVFNSGDLVTVFVAGEFEDATALNSGWGEGDWNCDRDFTSSDIVLAFTRGDYSAEATPVLRNARASDARLASAAQADAPPQADNVPNAAEQRQRREFVSQPAATVPKELTAATVDLLFADVEDDRTIRRSDQGSAEHDLLDTGDLR